MQPLGLARRDPHTCAIVAAVLLLPSIFSGSRYASDVSDILGYTDTLSV